MNNVDYKAMLYEKMNNEQNSYRKWLLSQQPAEILNHTYEYTTREDILMCMEELSLQPKQLHDFIQPRPQLARYGTRILARRRQHIHDGIAFFEQNVFSLSIWWIRFF